MDTLTIKREADGTMTILVLGRKWSDLSTGARIRTGLLFALGVSLGLVEIGLVVAALRDLRRRSSEEIAGNRWVWAFLAFVPPGGPVAYFLFGRRPPKAES